jgi:hypothetical protein
MPMLRIGRRTRALAVALIVSFSVLSGSTSAHADGITIQQAVDQAVANAAAAGVVSYISVVDRSTGAVLAETPNANDQVGSESVMKLLLAAYYLVANGGYQSTPPALLNRLSYMLRVSDDHTASALFTASAIPAIADRYGLSGTTNATDRVGHWGAARITAHDMTTFLWRASQDPAVGPWLFPVMAQTSPFGSDGFNQAFGLNALSGDHGSKQGWGSDSFFTRYRNAIHSVGYTDRYHVSILQTAPGYAVMRGTATTTATLIQSSTGIAVEGEFVHNDADGTIWRIAGGAPIYVSSLTAVPGLTSFRHLSASQFAALPAYPVDGTLLLAGDDVYMTAGGAPIYVADPAVISGRGTPTPIDPSAVAFAGDPGPWSHLRRTPADGTILASGTQRFITAGGAPTYITDFALIGRSGPEAVVDPNAVLNAGGAGRWSHLNAFPADGTLVVAGATNSHVYVIAGGAPIYVSGFAAIGGPRPAAMIDPVQVALAGIGDPFNHLRYRPADGTVLAAGDTLYRVVNGIPEAVPAGTPGPAPVVVDPFAISNAGLPSPFDHLVTR